MARLVQPGVEKLLGQPLIIENRPGAGGLLAIDAVAKSPPDGYVIGVGGTAALGSNHGFQAKGTIESRKDVAPVTGLAGSPFMLAAAPSFQGKSVRDIIALAKAPGQQADHRPRRQRHAHASDRRAVQPDGGDQARARPLSRHGAGGDRPDRRPRGVRHHPIRRRRMAAIEAGKIKAVAVTSLKRSAAPARHSNLRRVRRAGLRVQRLVRHRGARRHAGRRDRQAQRRVREGPQRSGDRQAHPRARRRAAADDAGASSACSSRRRPRKWLKVAGSSPQPN